MEFPVLDQGKLVWLASSFNVIKMEKTLLSDQPSAACRADDGR